MIESLEGSRNIHIAQSIGQNWNIYAYLRKSYVNREPQETDFKNYGPVVSVY